MQVTVRVYIFRVVMRNQFLYWRAFCVDLRRFGLEWTETYEHDHEPLDELTVQIQSAKVLGWNYSPMSDDDFKQFNYMLPKTGGSWKLFTIDM